MTAGRCPLGPFHRPGVDPGCRCPTAAVLQARLARMAADRGHPIPPELPLETPADEQATLAEAMGHDVSRGTVDDVPA